jgi:CENP-B N-terminal DNA-binding domain
MGSEKKKILTLKEKYKILCELDAGAKQSDVAHTHGVYPSVVHSVKKNKESILSALYSRPLSTRKVKTTPFDSIDNKLFDWFKELRQKKCPHQLPYPC